ncbi:ATP synthase B chain [Richelia intracellularis HH01]|jgi:F-type H+-transporting ATPase subunit b|uniref:ATP synthase subunit b n=1 Tax=Richelia intracellularis HH01 TaxID=1165094 RepID=M1X5K3_9NOST|nr:F0F1 ATP synthase subunit B [Richelia intracellularis]CCH67416.1 ATP synthase B chain [Richelia intracellularis HH01]
MSIMGTVLLLATESEGGFGLNLDILETNIVNLGLLIGILFYFGRNVLTNTLSERRSKIEKTIVEAETKAKEAAITLSEVQQKLTQAQAEAKQLIATAEDNAKAIRESILVQAEEDVKRLEETAARDLNAERDRAIAQLRQQVVAMSLQKVESELQVGVAEETQQKLIDSSIVLLGG